MKKIQVVALAAVVAFGAILTSCGGGVSTNVTLKNEKDTVSYAYGVSMFEQGLLGHLTQMGIYTDTANIKMTQMMQLSAATDEAQKAELTKKFKTQLDSIVKENNRNLSEFFKGFKESFSATPAQKAYLVGVSTGTQLADQMLPRFVSQFYGADAKVDENINKDIFLAGFYGASKKEKLSLENAADLLQQKAVEMQQKQEAKQKEEHAKEVEKLKVDFKDQFAASDKFFNENKTKDGVVTLPNGMQYKILKEGKGAMPKASDIVKVNYKGTLLDGTVFDSNEGKEPITFNVQGVIPGWTQALQLMPVGSKWMLYIPAELAYNERAMGDKIKPFSSLIFEVELLGIEQAQQQPQMQRPQMPRQ